MLGDMFKMAHFYSCQSVLTAPGAPWPYPLTPGSSIGTQLGCGLEHPPGPLQHAGLSVVGSQLPAEPVLQEDQARSHTGALALLPAEQSGRKATGFERKDLELTSPSGRARDGDEVVVTSGRCNSPPHRPSAGRC